MTKPLLISLLFGVSCFCSSLPHADVSIFEKIESIPRGWKHVRDALSTEPMTLSISMREQNVDTFEQLVLDISTPGHEKYGQHLKQDEVAAILRPHENATRSVVNWLAVSRSPQSYGIHSVHDNGEWIDFNSDVGTVEKVLATQYSWFSHNTTGEMIRRTTEYSLPNSIAQHINYISPTIQFSLNRRIKSLLIPKGQEDDVADGIYNDRVPSLPPDTEPLETATPNHSCDRTITPQCLFNLYNIHYGAPKSTINKTSLAFASYLKEYARYDDLEKFSKTIAPWTIGRNFSVLSINGGGNNQSDTRNDYSEANLDCQYVIGVGNPVPVTELSVGGCGPLVPEPEEPAGSCMNEPYERFLRDLLTLPDSELPQVISSSYGDDEQTWRPSAAAKVCNMVAQLGARGSTFVVASGDSGPGSFDDYCENNNGTKTMYVPHFPATCPFCTSVGGTFRIPEKAAAFSSGGFSNYFPIPAYQKTAVETYMKMISPNISRYYNHTGRGFPDVSAQSYNFHTVDGGKEDHEASGTSASAPVFASVIALLNAARISQGKSTLGFVNPFLYANPNALNDITIGHSFSCLNYEYEGFNATKGWDAVTGLGTPNFDELLKLAAPGVPNTGGPISE